MNEFEKNKIGKINTMHGQLTTSLATLDDLTREDEGWINSIIKSEGSTLPAVISDILPILAFTKGKAAAFKSLVTSTKNIEAQKEIHQSALESGQRYAQAALYSEAKLGDMLSVREKPKTITEITKRDKLGRTLEVKAVGLVGETLSSIGVTNSQSGQSQIIAKASKDGTLEEVIKKAEETGNMATKSAVITAMRVKKRQEMDRQYKEEKKNAIPPDINEALYKISETLTGLWARTEKMAPYVEHLNPLYVSAIIKDCNKIIDILEGTI